MDQRQASKLHSLFTALTTRDSQSWQGGQRDAALVGVNKLFGIEFLVILKKHEQVSIYWPDSEADKNLLFRLSVIGDRFGILYVPRMAPADDISWNGAMDYFRKELGETTNMNI